ncbi:MAG: hypothetical protein ACRC8S_02330 [Fimbriiglobus sp.]
MTLFAASIYWHFPVLVLTFSLVYSATRHDRWDLIAKETKQWIIKITAFLIIIPLGLYLLNSVF